LCSGSSDQEASQAIRTICLHIEAMLPPTSLELNIAQNIQVAALLGLGLLYQGSAHRHIAEVLLSEIGMLNTLLFKKFCIIFTFIEKNILF
jgi:hypothetical protein